MGTAREAHDAAAAALATGLPVLVSFVLDPRGNGALLSGEDLETAAARVRALAVHGAVVSGFLVNCTPCDAALAGLARLLSPGDSRPVGAYANLGAPDTARGWRDDPEATPAAYAAWARVARERGARLLGGCCGTTPDHIRALSAAVTRPA
jgi:S-methylmethionine-dependent homocysteine/selenocysteine methylase